jgi:hypothetical protein
MPYPPPEHVPVAEGERRAGFPVWQPGGTRAADWELQTCTYVGASTNPRSGPSVHLTYRARGSDSWISISESPAEDRGSVYDEVIGPVPWPVLRANGVDVRVGGTDLISRGGQAQAHLQRDGTFIFLMSETLPRQDLAELAGSLTRVSEADQAD